MTSAVRPIILQLEALLAWRIIRSMPGVILWFTGLPSAGKSTLAKGVRDELCAVTPVEVLDGDEFRREMSPDLGFTRQDRETHIRRIGVVARLLARHGVLAIVAAIAPYVSTRQENRRAAENSHIVFIEVYVYAAAQSLVSRDIKGLYKRAIAGELLQFTGISDPYEPPSCPDLAIQTDAEPVESSVARVVRLLQSRGVVPPAVECGSSAGS